MILFQYGNQRKKEVKRRDLRRNQKPVRAVTNHSYAIELFHHWSERSGIAFGRDSKFRRDEWLKKGRRGIAGGDLIPRDLFRSATACGHSVYRYIGRLSETLDINRRVRVCLAK